MSQVSYARWSARVGSATGRFFPSRSDQMDNSGTGGGLRAGFGLFGGGGGGGAAAGGSVADYSQPDLSRVPLTGMSPLSPYLNLDPRYLIQDTDEFILPTGANKTRGRFELAFFTIGGCCMTGAAIGAVNGLRLGLKETRDMAWSKPRNVQILNMVTRQGALWANTLGSLALLYSTSGVVIEKVRGAEDDLNTVAAGSLTGLLYKSTAGFRGAARGGFIGFTLTGLYALYNNWDHIKGMSVRHSL
ncbi:mitochondrial import inner membrane translocase subunit Tim23-like isoform X2 [Narcine bancroftii]|uniref:mitochondrial import inner membrane translocase subunit Tim23-like isoform X2 n=1 Tax=Narcine bancroftii TaxID=1343680 RepID=UPI003831ED6B